jgi:hypothetical protein
LGIGHPFLNGRAETPATRHIWRVASRVTITDQNSSFLLTSALAAASTVK